MNITELKALGQKCVDAIAELKQDVWVTTESELSRKVPNLRADDFPLLVMVTPSFDVEGQDADNVRDVAQLLFFVLKKGGFQSEKESTQEADMNETLLIIQQIKSYLLNGFPAVEDCSLPNHIVPHSFHIDPEFNYLGCNGWSMSFQIKTG
jgi:hypothetical protein